MAKKCWTSFIDVPLQKFPVVLTLLPHNTTTVGTLPMMYLKDEYHAKEGQACRHSVQIGSNIDRVSLL